MNNTPKRKCLITGANGFVGKALAEKLNYMGWETFGAVRSNVEGINYSHIFVTGEIGGKTDWMEALVEQEVVIHLANRAHVIRDSAADPLYEYRKANVDGTLALARQASEAGVRRFVFISSIKVNGERTAEKPFRPEDPPSPVDPYAVSKWEAEQGLSELSENTGMELVIIRPPLVYGPGVKGNLASMRNIINKGFPLPFAGIHNQRDLIGLGNLIDLITVCISHPKAAGQTFLCSDGTPLSTPELVGYIAQAQNRSPRLFRLPDWVLSIGSSLLGKKDLYERLTGDLQVDMEHTKTQLGWSPKYSVEEGMARAFDVST